MPLLESCVFEQVLFLSYLVLLWTWPLTFLPQFLISSPLSPTALKPQIWRNYNKWFLRHRGNTPLLKHSLSLGQPENEVPLMAEHWRRHKNGEFQYYLSVSIFEPQVFGFYSQQLLLQVKWDFVSLSSLHTTWRVMGCEMYGSSIIRWMDCKCEYHILWLRTNLVTGRVLMIPMRTHYSNPQSGPEKLQRVKCTVILLKNVKNWFM